MSGGDRRFLALSGGQADRNDGTHPFRRADLEDAAMEFGQRAGNGKPQTGTRVAFRELILNLLKGAPQFFQGVARYPAT